MPSVPKYPSTPYWPWSPSFGRDDDVHPSPEHFVGTAVVVTEKLDGGNTLLHAGTVYGRSVSTPSDGKWMSMVKKHHAWKVTEPGVYLYGEDIYGVHSIEYEPVVEERTFYAFALRRDDGRFGSFAEVEKYAGRGEMPVVPDPVQRLLPVGGRDPRVREQGAPRDVRAGRRAGGRRVEAGAGVPGGRVPGQRLQERPRGPRTDGPTLDPQLEALSNREPLTADSRPPRASSVVADQAAGLPNAIGPEFGTR